VRGYEGSGVPGRRLPSLLQFYEAVPVAIGQSDY
jgi:hypothetical protein